MKKDQSCLYGYECWRNLIEIQCTFCGWLAKHEYQTFPQLLTQYSALLLHNTETAFIMCSSSAFLSVDLKKKVKFCGCILVFCSESCSKEFLWWGERVWTNRQADLGNDKHVLPLPDSSSAPLSLSHSFTQDRKQSSFSNCNFEKGMFFIFSLLLIYFFW